jgi:hypothetical protein
MKTITKINYAFILLPILLGILGAFNEQFLYYLLLSFIPLGIFQVGVAILHSKQFNKNLHYRLYTYGVMLFFSLAFTAQFWWDYLEPYGGIVCALPPILAIYFSIILHNKTKKS